MVYACSTPKTYMPVTGPSASSLSSSIDRRQPASSSTHNAVTQPAPASVPVHYDFIRDPAKKAFFESSPAQSSPAVATSSGSRSGAQTDRQPMMYDRSDVDINMEAKINQYVCSTGIWYSFYDAVI